MPKIAALLPREYMLVQARQLITEKDYPVDILRVITTADAVAQARLAIAEGVGIIIARGGQAMFMKQFTKVPIVEIRLTGQELGRLVQQAKQLVTKERPQIALVGFANMYSDTQYFDEIFAVKLKRYFIRSLEETADKVRLALAEGADVILGGDAAMELARQYQVPTLFFESTAESLRLAFETAAQMKRAAELEKNYIAQFETVLDTSSYGIIKIDTKRQITNVNKLMEEVMGTAGSGLKGQRLVQLLPELDSVKLDSVMSGNRDVYTTSLRLRNTSFMLTVVPIISDGVICGGLLNFYQLTRQEGRRAEQFKEREQQGYYAGHRFSGFRNFSAAIKETVEQAKLYALSSRPVLIASPPGTEWEQFAQAIHNNSVYKGGPFITVSCAGLTEDAQLKALFGAPADTASPDSGSGPMGALEAADYGTVLIAEVDKLALSGQQRLYRALRYAEILQTGWERRSKTLQARVILTTQQSLATLVTTGAFRPDLYYLLSGLVLEIPPLSKRPTDIEHYAKRQLQEFTAAYASHIRLSEPALQTLQEYDWPGNVLQLEAFCERLFLTTPKKIIAAEYVRFLLAELYPEIIGPGGRERSVIYKHPEARQISVLLAKHHGNKSAVAREMGISTTTLWRHIKKYGVTAESEQEHKENR